MADYIPTNNDDFERFYKNLVFYIKDNTTGTNPRFAFMDAAEVSALGEGYITWHTKYLECIGPHTSVQTQEMNDARKAGTKIIRRFKHRQIDYHDEITVGDLIAMMFKAPDENQTPQDVTSLRPELVVENTRSRLQHLLRALNPLTGKRGKPKGAYGICVAVQIGGTKPLSGEAMADKKFHRATLVERTYGEEHKGLVVYYSVCYENARGDRGPWSIVVEAIIA